MIPKPPPNRIIKQRNIRQQPQPPKLKSNAMLIYPNDDRYKIALIQPASWGDNINSTLMFKPLKAKWPNSIIDVYTSSLYANAFHNNPFIHKLIEIPAANRDLALHQVIATPPTLVNCGYNLIFNPHPMINPDKWTSVKHGELGTNLICAWVRALEDADVDYPMPLETVLCLTDAEVASVEQYRSHVPPGRNILMETESRSGQSFWDGNWTNRVCRHLLNGNTNLFLSRQSFGPDVQELVDHAPGRVHFVGKLSIRECAELFNHCDAFFSVSSGLSNACNTSWCRKDRRWVETINSDAVSSGPIRRDNKIFWMDNSIDNFISMLRNNGI